MLTDNIKIMSNDNIEMMLIGNHEWQFCEDMRE